ncbi:Y4yA family PLP-dependent enzyme [Nitrosomonas sp. Is37]|uniref:Y4yA family PLP-dependent enzyme n=1 Tax=Nitrosomonas sp. Is37 TaxID=3080535 RepID=UPI00294B6D07|nr:Y4yA family PLP-dependent enzyme [Nitrosomonas sp. Is37]MDV6344224.1 Y4yA family PLP-dependent enzyme [Nitrosomonas sp. Is37]
MQDNFLQMKNGAEHIRASIPIALPPILNQSITDIVYSSPHTLLDLVDRYGSPLHVIWPHILQLNVDAFRAILHAHALRFEIFYGAKVNKSLALVRAAVESGIGVDVSSIYELRDALAAGADPSRICATGPAKTPEFHAELVTNASLISIDSIEEFSALEQCVRRLAPLASSPRKARLLLRYRPALATASRFGMSGDDLLQCLRRLTQLREQFAFEGFHFHLGGYAHETRAQALRELTAYVDAACSLDLRPRIIDIGGGLPIQYVESDQYEAFLRSQCSEHYRNGKVPASFYAYGGRINACEWLHRLLESPCANGLSIAQYLKTMDLVLAIEPGRCLVDQTAISMFRITCIKPQADGNNVIFVEGSSFSACETWFASEYLVDPILVSRAASCASQNVPTRAYIAGHSCLDEDVITNRLIDFESMPQAGDLLVYANTSGYQMDLLENEFHRHPMPRRIAVTYNTAGGMEFSPD